MKAVAVAQLAEGVTETARAKAASALRSWLPRVAVLDARAIACDLRGTARLLGPAASVGARIVVTCESAGAACAVGIAPTPFVARVLGARAALGTVRELHGTARELLAPLPLAALPLDERVAAELGLLGLRDVGAFAALERGAVLDRFGRAAAAAHALACGDDTGTVGGVPPLRRIRAARRFDDAISSKEQLVFALRAIVDEVVAQLAADGLAAMRVRLRLERELPGSRPGGTPAPGFALDRLLLPPAAQPAAILRSLRWALDERGELGAVTAAYLEATEVEPQRGRQLGLFAPDGARADEAIAIAQHLRGRLGAGTVLRARVSDPDARLPERESEWSEVVA